MSSAYQLQRDSDLFDFYVTDIDVIGRRESHHIDTRVGEQGVDESGYVGKQDETVSILITYLI